MAIVLYRNALGQVLRAQRAAQGKTLREISLSARVSLGYLSEVERGQKEASSELFGSICSALGQTQSQVIFLVAAYLANAEDRQAKDFG